MKAPAAFRVIDPPRAVAAPVTGVTARVPAGPSSFARTLAAFTAKGVAGAEWPAATSWVLPTAA